jgi:hypothetical protein
MTLENVDLLNRAIRPFRLDGPLLAVALHYAENGNARLYGHADIYCGLSGH